MARSAGLIRLSHPFPSVLDGAITAVLALVVGGGAGRAAVLGTAMVALQASIGALNDLVDVDRDRGRKPGKPIPAGAVDPQSARAVVLLGASIGLALSSLVSFTVAAVALAGTAVGYAYDLRLKSTPWAWLPFAIGLPLLPVYAWVGAIGRVPVAYWLAMPLAVVAGAAVALSNGLVDLDRDRASGTDTPAVRLGARRARQACGGLLAIVVIGIGATLAASRAAPVAWLIVLAGTALIVIGSVALGDRFPERRERGWEACAIGIGLLAAGWTVGLAGRGLL